MYTNPNMQSVMAPLTEYKDITGDVYFIVDWVGNDPVRTDRRTPIVIAGNITEEELEQIRDGKIKLESPRFGTKQRVLLKVVAIEKL